MASTTSVSSSSSTSSGTISSAGIGSGLDVATIVDKLMAIEQKPLDALKTKATSIQTSISAYGSVKSSLAALRDAASGLSRPAVWQSMNGTSADPTAVTVSTATGAAAGSYAINVANLATAQSTVSPTYASSSALVGAGSLHIDIAGTGGFADPSTTGVDVTVDATDTLQSLADKINQAAGGVSAAIVTDATGARLSLSSSQTGVQNQFRIAGTNSDGGSGLAALSFDPRSTTTGATTLTQAAVDAHATINGLTVTSATNTLSSVLPGLTIGLVKTTTSAVQVGVAQDKDAIKKAVTSFVDAYNTLSKLLSDDLKYDAATSTAGPLQADSAAIAVQRQLRGILGSSSAASSTFSTLSSAGLQIQSDGTLSVDDTTLTNALNNTTELKKMFAATSSGAIDANSGFAQRFRYLGDTLLGSDGALSSRITGLGQNLTRNQTDQTKTQERLDATKARITKQYNALDTQMASISTLSTYITQQIANWNKSS